MRLSSAFNSVAAIGLILAGLVANAEARDPDKALLQVNVQNDMDLKRLEAAGVDVYARLHAAGGPVLLVGADPRQSDMLKAQALDLKTLDPVLAEEQYYVVYRMPRTRHLVLGEYGTVLYEEETLAVMRMSPEDAEKLAEAGAELRAVTLDPKPLRNVSLSRYARSMPTAITPDPLVQGMIAKVDSAIVHNYTGDLSGEWPATIGGSPYTIATRYTYSGEPIQKATQYVGEHLADLGLAVEYHEWADSTCPNVIGELPGKGSPDSIVIICAHLDDMPPGPLAPGADDNASGTAAVLVAADILTQYDWHFTLRFALWTGEEEGLWGSRYYATRSIGLGEHIVGVLNLDMIAYNTIGSPRDIDLHADQTMPETMDLAQLFADVVSAYGMNLICQIVPNGTGGSDHASFWDFGYSAILGIEDLDDFNPNYHTTSDLLANADMSYYVDFVKASVATCAHMAGVQASGPALPAVTAPALVLLSLLVVCLGLYVATRKRVGPQSGYRDQD